MTTLLDIFTALAVIAGVVFFLAGTLGLIRFPDTLSRLHALSKADNVGLGLIVLGLLPQAPGLVVALKLIAIWVLAQISAATATQLIAAIPARRMPDP